MMGLDSPGFISEVVATKTGDCVGGSDGGHVRVWFGCKTELDSILNYGRADVTIR